MGLECLIITCDSTLLGHIQAGLTPHGVSVHLRQDSASAVELASRRHLDGLVVDCDGVADGRDAMAQLRNTPANKQTFMLAISNGITSTEEALDLGANFALCKPIQQSRLRRVLDTAIPKMEREHRRYFRHDVDLPVQFRNPLGESFAARMRNISEGGLAIKLIDPVKLSGVVAVEFELPSVQPRPFHAKAEVIWSDSFAMGLRFLYIEKQSQTALHEWLESLEAQMRLKH